MSGAPRAVLYELGTCPVRVKGRTKTTPMGRPHAVLSWVRSGHFSNFNLTGTESLSYGMNIKPKIKCLILLFFKRLGVNGNGSHSAWGHLECKKSTYLKTRRDFGVVRRARDDGGGNWGLGEVAVGEESLLRYVFANIGEVSHDIESVFGHHRSALASICP